MFLMRLNVSTEYQPAVLGVIDLLPHHQATRANGTRYTIRRGKAIQPEDTMVGKLNDKTSWHLSKRKRVVYATHTLLA